MPEEIKERTASIDANELSQFQDAIYRRVMLYMLSYGPSSTIYLDSIILNNAANWLVQTELPRMVDLIRDALASGQHAKLDVADLMTAMECIRHNDRSDKHRASWLHEHVMQLYVYIRNLQDLAEKMQVKIMPQYESLVVVGPNG